MKYVGVMLYLAVVLNAPSQAGSVQAHLQSNPSEILLFSLPGCTHCISAKSLMSRKRLPYREVDLTTDEGIRLAEQLNLPLMAPTFSYKNKILQGFVEEDLIRFIEK